MSSNLIVPTIGFKKLEKSGFFRFYVLFGHYFRLQFIIREEGETSFGKGGRGLLQGVVVSVDFRVIKIGSVEFESGGTLAKGFGWHLLHEGSAFPEDFLIKTLPCPRIPFSRALQ